MSVEDSVEAAGSTERAQSTKGQRRRINYNSSDPDAILAQNRQVAPAFQREKHKKDAARHWDIFYKVRIIHSARAIMMVLLMIDRF